MNLFRIVKLPPALSPNNNLALTALVARDHVRTTYARLWLGRNFAFNGSPPESFFEAASIRYFAFHGKVTEDFSANAPILTVANQLPTQLPANQPLPLASGLKIQLDGPDLILPETFDFDAVANALLVFIGDEIMSLAAADLTGIGQYTLTMIRSRFGSALADHVAGADIYIIPQIGLMPLQHPFFAVGNTCRFKLTLGVQHPSMVDAIDQLL